MAYQSLALFRWSINIVNIAPIISLYKALVTRSKVRVQFFEYGMLWWDDAENHTYLSNLWFYDYPLSKFVTKTIIFSPLSTVFPQIYCRQTAYEANSSSCVTFHRNWSQNDLLFTILYIILLLLTIYRYTMTSETFKFFTHLVQYGHSETIGTNNPMCIDNDVQACFYFLLNI